MKITLKLSVAVLAMATTASNADVIFTIEAPGVQQTTVPGALTETFDAANILNTGLSGYSAANGGNYTGGQVVPGTTSGGAFGGANGTAYLVTGLQQNFPTSTATFTTDLTYFGMWWAAGDAANQLRFYDDNVLLRTFQVGDLLSLGSDYFGNPNNGLDMGEPFVYLNFTGTDGTRFDKIEFSNTSRSGFESDNHSTFDQPITPPGIRVPDAASSGGLLAMSLGVLALVRGRFQK